MRTTQEERAAWAANRCRASVYGADLHRLIDDADALAAAEEENERLREEIVEMSATISDLRDDLAALGKGGPQ